MAGLCRPLTTPNVKQLVFARNSSTRRATRVQISKGLERTLARVDLEFREELVAHLEIELLRLESHWRDRVDKAQDVALAAKDKGLAAKDEALAATKLAMTVQDNNYILSTHVTHLMRRSGLLNVCGVLEVIEEEACAHNPKYHALSRRELWQELVNANAALRDCLLSCTRAQQSYLGRYLAEIYRLASDTLHSRKTAQQHTEAFDIVTIEEATFSATQCRAIKCVCDAYSFPNKIKLNQTSVTDS